MKRAAFLTTCLAALLLASAASAAPAPAAPTPPARPAGPEVKPIGDWSVRCFPAESPSPCDMYEELDDKNSRQRVLSLSLAYIPKMDRHALMIAVPLGISIPSGVVIQTDNFTSAPLHYRRCDRQGCYVEMLVDNASVDSLTKSGPNGRIKVVADGGKTFELRFSLNGFAAAHDSMAALAKEKAKEPKPATAAIDASAPAPK